MVKMATSFGRSGLHDWVMQRISAVLLAAFTIYIFSFMLKNQSLTHDAWVVLFHNEFFRVLSIMTLVALVVHAWIGLWTVATDYIKSTGLRFVFQAGVMLFVLGDLIWGVRILWGL